MDVEHIRAGKFMEIIQDEISKVDYFILVLAPTTYKSDFVRDEIEMAVHQEKTIIPVCTKNYRPERLVTEFPKVDGYNAISLNLNYTKDFETKLRKAIRVTPKSRRWFTPGTIITIITFLAALETIFGINSTLCYLYDFSWCDKTETSASLTFPSTNIVPTITPAPLSIEPDITDTSITTVIPTSTDTLTPSPTPPGQCQLEVDANDLPLYSEPGEPNENQPRLSVHTKVQLLDARRVENEEWVNVEEVGVDHPPRGGWIVESGLDTSTEDRNCIRILNLNNP